MNAQVRHNLFTFFFKLISIQYTTLVFTLDPTYVYETFYLCLFFFMYAYAGFPFFLILISFNNNHINIALYCCLIFAFLYSKVFYLLGNILYIFWSKNIRIKEIKNIFHTRFKSIKSQKKFLKHLKQESLINTNLLRMKDNPLAIWTMK